VQNKIIEYPSTHLFARDNVNPVVERPHFMKGFILLIFLTTSLFIFSNAQSKEASFSVGKYGTENFESTFQTELPNFYHTFNQIRIRKKNRTLMLDTLREKFIQRMERLDGG
jgi:hypothetical protein